MYHSSFMVIHPLTESRRQYLEPRRCHTCLARQVCCRSDSLLVFTQSRQTDRGNELADKLTKEVIGWRQTRGRGGRLVEIDTDNIAAKPNFLEHLRPSAQTELTRRIESQGNRDWKNQTKGRTTHRPTPTPTRDLREEVWERTDLREILNTPRLAKKAARFMILMRLFGQYGVISQIEISQGAH